LYFGIGYDIHRLAEDRRLVLGGVEIPHERGLLGHSDADVLVHAIMDALLGAAGLGDIGRHFPDSDPALKGISSLILLERVGGLLRREGLRPLNIDSTVIAEAPRLAPWIPEMRRRIAGALGLGPERVNVKATTNEGMGSIGHGEGIAAYAVVGLISDGCPTVSRVV
jgi:2-C-methyl-D-erythritol 2,4-cyclodiphosphate synthase